MRILGYADVAMDAKLIPEESNRKVFTDAQDEFKKIVVLSLSQTRLSFISTGIFGDLSDSQVSYAEAGKRKGAPGLLRLREHIAKPSRWFYADKIFDFKQGKSYDFRKWSFKINKNETANAKGGGVTSSSWLRILSGQLPKRVKLSPALPRNRPVDAIGRQKHFYPHLLKKVHAARRTAPSFESPRNRCRTLWAVGLHGYAKLWRACRNNTHCNE